MSDRRLNDFELIHGIATLLYGRECEDLQLNLAIDFGCEREDLDGYFYHSQAVPDEVWGKLGFLLMIHQTNLTSLGDALVARVK